MCGLPAEPVWNAGIFLVATAFVLSRLLLVAANFPSFLRFPVLLLAVPSLTPAGLALTAAATLIYLRWKRLPLLAVLDAWAPCATLLWVALALGHFAEGSDPGMPAGFGVRMPGDSLRTHPVALYVALFASVLTVLLLERLRRAPVPGNIAALALVAGGGAQFLLSFLRQPAASAWGLDPLEWLALGMVVAGALLLARPAITQER